MSDAQHTACDDAKRNVTHAANLFYNAKRKNDDALELWTRFNEEEKPTDIDSDSKKWSIDRQERLGQAKKDYFLAKKDFSLAEKDYSLALKTFVDSVDKLSVSLGIHGPD